MMLFDKNRIEMKGISFLGMDLSTPKTKESEKKKTHVYAMDAVMDIFSGIGAIDTIGKERLFRNKVYSLRAEDGDPDPAPDDVELMMLYLFRGDCTMESYTSDLSTGVPYVLVDFDRSDQTLRPVAGISPDGGLLAPQDPKHFLSPEAKERALLKREVKTLLQQIVDVNAVLNDTSTDLDIGYTEYRNQKRRRNQLFLEIACLLAEAGIIPQNILKHIQMTSIEKSQQVFNITVNGGTINNLGGTVGTQNINCPQEAPERQTAEAPDRRAEEESAQSPLDTPEAMRLWNIARAHGWVDGRRLPTGTLSSKAKQSLLASVMSSTLRITPKYEPFERLWGVSGLMKSFSNAMEATENTRLYKEIYEAIR